MPAKAARRAEGRKNAGRRGKQSETGGPSSGGKPFAQPKGAVEKRKFVRKPRKPAPARRATNKHSDVNMKAAEKAAAKQLAKKKLVKKSGHPPEKLTKRILPEGPVTKILKPKVDRKQRLQGAVVLWEDLRRHDTAPEQRATQIADVLTMVEGRALQMATSPKGSRVLQACVKHGSPQQRAALLRQLQPQLVELSRSPYANFLIRKLISKAAKDEIDGLVARFKGHIGMLLRHPSGSAVLDELYSVASGPQRNHLAAEIYGKEFTLLSQEAAPAHLSELLEGVDGVKRRTILQRMAVVLHPVMEKAIVDPVLTHRLVCEYILAAEPGARQEAFESLAGEPMLRMVHTRNGAHAACALLTHGSAKDCKKFIKALKGHVETMAKDRWGSVVLAAALSSVDDTLLMRKILLPTLQEKCLELMDHKHASLAYLQLLAPDQQRYIAKDIQDMMCPQVREAATAPDAAASQQEQAAVEGPGRPRGQRKKDSKLRRTELLGTGEDSFAAALLAQATASTAELLASPGASSVVVELSSGGCDGILLDEHSEAVDALQDAVAELMTADIAGSGEVVGTTCGLRTFRRLLLATAEAKKAQQKAARLAKRLRRAAAAVHAESSAHAAKVLETLAKCDNSQHK